MEITGTVIKILEPQSGVSSRNGEKWVKNFFVIETGGQYPRKVAFSVFGEDKWSQFAVQVGKNYNVQFDIDAREWNGKWFNDLSAWRVVCLDAQSQKPAPQPQPNTAPTGAYDNTPF